MEIKLGNWNSAECAFRNYHSICVWVTWSKRKDSPRPQCHASETSQQHGKLFPGSKSCSPWLRKSFCHLPSEISELETQWPGFYYFSLLGLKYFLPPALSLSATVCWYVMGGDWSSIIFLDSTSLEQEDPHLGRMSVRQSHKIWRSGTGDGCSGRKSSETVSVCSVW